MENLIVYTTKHGSVTEAVNILKPLLDGDTDVVNLMTDATPKLGKYKKVILGASIYVGKLQKEMTEFIMKHKEELLGKALGIFVMAGEDDPAKRIRQFETAYGQDIYDHAAAKEIFGDAVYWERLNFMEKIAMKMLKGVKEGYENIVKENIIRLANKMNKIQ